MSQNNNHSTGPKTPEGKQRSSQNALTHGLTAQTVVLPTEDLTAYEIHVANFMDEYHPHGATETQLVQALADTSWRQNRIVTLENQVMDGTNIWLEDQIRAVANLSIHSHRLSRQFAQTLAQLQALQQPRLVQEQKDLNDLLEIIELQASKGETYNHTEAGFVFTDAQIQAGVIARERELLAIKASKVRYF